MPLDFKIFKLRFTTANKTVEDVKKDYNTGMPSDEMLQAITEAYRALDGLEIIGGEFNYSPDSYSLMNWNAAADDKIKEFIWLQEQDPHFSNYYDDRERFDKDWETDEYEPVGSLHFNKSDLEIVERIVTKDEKLAILNTIPVHTHVVDEDNEVSSVLCDNNDDNRIKIAELGYTQEQIDKFVTNDGRIEMLKFATKIAESAHIVEGVFTSWSGEVA